MKLPKVKSENIVVQSLGDETLIYNLTTNKAFCLNQTLSKVFNACDGQTDLAQLKSQYKFTDDLIHFALDELRTVGLLTETATAGYFAGMSRREVIRKVGLASMVALPVVSALVAPSAAAAASGPKPIGAACTGPSRNNTTCVTGRCKVAPPAGTCCIDENDRNLYTCTNAATDCCLGSSACVSGRCCRPSGINCGTDNTLCCSGVCSNSACT